MVISDLLANPAFTPAMNDFHTLLQGDETMLQATLPYAPASYTMATVRDALTLAVSYNHFVHNFIGESSMLDLIKSDPSAETTGIVNYLASFDANTIGRIRAQLSEKIGSVRDMYKEHANSGDLSFDRLATQVIGYIFVSCDADSLSGKYDVLKAYSDAIKTGGNSLVAGSLMTDSTQWTTAMGSSLCNVAKLAIDDTKTSIKGLAERVTTQLAQVEQLGG